jgi:hypothetical protein
MAELLQSRLSLVLGAPFYQAGPLIMIKPVIGNTIYHETASEYHPVLSQFSGDARSKIF